MNLIRVCGSYFPAKKMGGAVTADFTVDVGLVKKGANLQVLTTNAGLTQDQMIDREEIEGIIVNRFEYFGGENTSFTMKMLFRMWRMFCGFNGVVLFSGIWNVPTLVGPLMCRLLSVPYIITPHGCLYTDLVKRRKRLLKMLLLKTFVLSNLHKAKRVHFTVDSERLAAEELVGPIAGAKIIPLGVPATKRSFGMVDCRTNVNGDLSSLRKSKKFNILFVGRINWKKGLDYLFESIAKLPIEIFGDVRITLVGPEDVDELSRLKELSGCLGLCWGKDVVWKGPLYGDDLAKAYSDANLFALTSLSENFAVTVVEAAQAGLPILMTKQVGVSAFFSSGKNAEVVDLDVNEIAFAIERIWRDSDYAESLARAAKRLSSKFSVDRYVSDFEAMIMAKD